ncbi:hypothetical protein CORC01_07814 [Colletotrichum orchidophilum]|uniref:Jacalin-type lectin domain-containing protein n=1 Tax=Colletotrichum orchidophilum TaxID=1209926 RepID=A0A1G4B608_9PEZI|nr:uncharacterized protein CORC01_07814 [Colletotrichum orchidophilum]OHE96847.1 hypothetical protein CORC01_07814 [Colletotrichum orchidophilum]
MTFNTLLFKHLLTILASLATINPNIIDHGHFDFGGIDRLNESLTKSIRPTLDLREQRGEVLQIGDDADALFLRDLPALNNTTTTTIRPTLTPEPNRIKRQDAASSTILNSLTVAASDAFVSIDIQFFTSSTNMRAINTTSSGNTNSITSELEVWPDADVFKFENGDHIKEFLVLENRGSIHGFNFTTASGTTYSATGQVLRDPPRMQKGPVGSGILGRMRVQYCNIGQIGHLGFDLLDELQSVSVSNIAHSGFTDNIISSGPGQTMGIGSKIVDNRKYTAEQIVTVVKMHDVTKSYTNSVANQWNVEGRVTVEAEAGIPLIGKTQVTTEFSWQVQKTITEEDTEGETLTKSATINLKCPPKNYCVGSSFFTIFKMDVEVEATFRAKTKSGKDFFWKQKGKYEGADSIAL